MASLQGVSPVWNTAITVHGQIVRGLIAGVPVYPAENVRGNATKGNPRALFAKLKVMYVSGIQAYLRIRELIPTGNHRSYLLTHRQVPLPTHTEIIAQ